MKLPPLWVRWTIIAPGILTTLGVLAYFGVDWEDITPATVQFVVEEDMYVKEDIQEHYDGKFDQVLKKLDEQDETLGNVDTGVTVDRIVRILVIKCRDPANFPVGLQQTLNEQATRYHKLTGREFTGLEC